MAVLALIRGDDLRRVDGAPLHVLPHDALGVCALVVTPGRGNQRNIQTRKRLQRDTSRGVGLLALRRRTVESKQFSMRCTPVVVPVSHDSVNGPWERLPLHQLLPVLAPAIPVVHEVAAAHRPQHHLWLTDDALATEGG